MNFQEALQTVITTKKIVWRKMHQFDDDYDRPKNNNDPPTPWSVWLRIRIENDSSVAFDRLIFFETNNHDDVNNTWFLEWNEDNISEEDVMATDWEVCPDA